MQDQQGPCGQPQAQAFDASHEQSSDAVAHPVQPPLPALLDTPTKLSTLSLSNEPAAQLFAQSGHLNFTCTGPPVVFNYSRPSRDLPTNAFKVGTPVTVYL